jgi:DNA-binding transcriptional LysR family regulator
MLARFAQGQLRSRKTGRIFIVSSLNSAIFAPHVQKLEIYGRGHVFFGNRLIDRIENARSEEDLNVVPSYFWYLRWRRLEKTRTKREKLPMDLNDVTFFVQVVRSGSLADACRRLGVAPSTGTRRIQQLEKDLGVRLMQRTTRRMELTVAGSEFFEGCAEHVDALAASMRESTDSGDALRGRVRVAAPADFFIWFPMDQLAKFVAENPGIRLEFQLDDAPADLLRDSMDMAIGTGSLEDSTLVTRKIGCSRKTMVASPTYLEDWSTPGSPEDLLLHECITPPSATGAPGTWQVTSVAGTLSISVKSGVQVSTAQAQLHAALAGLGIAFLPAFISEPYLKAGALRNVLSDWGLEEIDVYFVYVSNRYIPRAVRAFSEFAREVMLGHGIVDEMPTLDITV